MVNRGQQEIRETSQIFLTVEVECELFPRVPGQVHAPSLITDHWNVMFVRCGSFPACPATLDFPPFRTLSRTLEGPDPGRDPEYVPELTSGLALTPTPILELSHLCFRTLF
jgi:hypothetical protein